MSEQISLSFTLLADGSKTACVSIIPVINGDLAPENVASAIVGSHNIDGQAESELVAAISAAIANFRTAKGI